MIILERYCCMTLDSHADFDYYMRSASQSQNSQFCKKRENAKNETEGVFY